MMDEDFFENETERHQSLVRQEEERHELALKAERAENEREEQRQRALAEFDAKGYVKARDLLLECRLNELLAEKKRLQRRLKTIEKAIKAHHSELPDDPRLLNCARPDDPMAADLSKLSLAKRQAIFERIRLSAAGDRWHTINNQLHAIGQATYDQLTELTSLMGETLSDPVMVLAETHTLLITESRARKRIRERKG